MEPLYSSGVGFVPAPQFANVVWCASSNLSAPGLKVDTVAHLTVTNNNVFLLRQGYSSNTIATSGLGSGHAFPTLTGPDLAFDNGSQPQNTPSCRVYTFFAEVNPVTAGVKLTLGYGPDFTKHTPQFLQNAFIGDGTKAIVGYLYIKNESSAPFIPGTTLLNASGITATPLDQFGFPIVIPN